MGAAHRLHCGHAQWLKVERLRWQKGTPKTAEYHCEGCETPIPEHHKTAMLEAGEWRATATSADPAGFTPTQPPPPPPPSVSLSSPVIRFPFDLIAGNGHIPAGHPRTCGEISLSASAGVIPDV